MLNRDEIRKEVDRHLKSYQLGKTRATVVEYLKTKGAHSQAVEDKLDEYEHFLKNGRLK